VLWIWLAVRTTLWTALITLTQPNAPLDLLEWLCWGQHWQWGYYKHPPLTAWMADCFVRLSPGSVWGVTLGSYLTTAVALWAVWRLGREMVSPRLALLAALCLDGVIVFTYNVAEFSNNVVLVSCWAVIVLCFHRALRTGGTGWWLATGLTVGLGLLTKYSVVFLLAPMLLLMLLHPEARRAWRRVGPYLAALLAATLFAPHVLWMIQNDFMTVSFARDRAVRAGVWLDHVRRPGAFALLQLAWLLPLFFVLLPLTSWRWQARPLSPREHFDRTFLLTLVLGPVGLLLLLSACFGLRLVAIWGYPLWTYTGLLLLLSLATDARPPAFRQGLLRWGVVVALFLVFTLVKDYSLLLPTKRTNFPGRRLAEEVERLWESRFAGPLPVIAGDQWLVSIVNCYSPHRPTPYFESERGTFDRRCAPWTSDEDLLRRGGVLVWLISREGNHLPPEFHEHFPNAEAQPPLVLPLERGMRWPPVGIGVAIVPPSQ
jgi:4-amino-4-deoxy-L-arabinose transferase-like glycosyltransferase